MQQVLDLDPAAPARPRRPRRAFEQPADPAVAAGVAAEGWIGEEETVLLLNTGAGIKYPGVITPSPRVLAVGETLG